MKKPSPSGLAFVHPAADGTDPDQLLSDVAHWVAWHSQFPPELAERVKDVMKGSSQRLDVFLNVMAIQRTRAVQAMFQNANNVQAELFSPGRIKRATTDELIRIWDALQKHMETALNFIKGMVEHDATKFVQEVEVQLRDMTVGMRTISSETPERREELRSMMLELAQFVGQTNGQQSNSPTGEAESASPADVRELESGRASARNGLPERDGEGRTVENAE